MLTKLWKSEGIIAKAVIFKKYTNNNVNNNDKNQFHLSNSSYQMAKVKLSHSKPGFDVICDNSCVKKL